MWSKFVISVTLFMGFAFAQSNKLNIDTAEETKVVDEVEGFVTTLEANPTFLADVVALITALPSSVIQESAQDPEALIGQIVTTGKVPVWVSAIPTPVVESLETLLAKPIKAVGDVESYLGQLSEEPGIISAISVQMTAIPISVQQAFRSNPAGFLENIATNTALPSWVTDIPAPIQSDIGYIVNEALSIIDKDLEGGASTTGALNGFVSSSGYAKATGTEGMVGFNGTSGGLTGTPVAYMGAAAPMKTAAAGLAALMVGAEVVFNV